MEWWNLTAGVSGWLQSIFADDEAIRLGAASLAGALVVLTLGVWLLSRRRRRRPKAPRHFPPATAQVVVPPVTLGDWGPVETLGARRRPSERPPASLLGASTGRLAGSLWLAVICGLAVWLVGLALAPDRRQFLASREWQFQPFYMAAHVVAVRMFTLTYARGFMHGVSHLALSDEIGSVALVRRLLGWPSVAAAAAIAAPLAYSDFFYMLSPEYDRLGGPGPVLPVNYLMWGLWSVEWLLNAYIWVVLLAFLAKNGHFIRRYPFRDPIEIVLHDAQYKPFLRMSGQGATILLAFSIVSVAYIWYTGGGITDYVGLMVTTALVFVGFVPTWLLLKGKVRQAVEAETRMMRERLLRNLAEAESAAQTATLENREGGSLKSLEHRMDAAVSILRISYLEDRHQRLGQTEARDVMLKLLAPAASIGWQAAKSYSAFLTEIKGYLLSLI